MKYENIVKAKFISRPNRFVAYVDIEGAESSSEAIGSEPCTDQGEPSSATKVHVKNTGRCKELLIPGATVYLEDFSGRMGSRALRYSLIAVEKEAPMGKLLVNMDSQAPNKAAAEALLSGKVELPGMGKLTLVKGERTYGDSRLDFYVEDVDGRKGFVEVKGVTLETAGVASFPDAPTERGIKHLRELSRAVGEGYFGYVLFVIQMKGMHVFGPNDSNHKAFGDALREAAAAEVGVLAYDCVVLPDSITIDAPVRVELELK